MSKAGPTGGALLLLGVLCAFGSGAALAADRFASTSGADAANDCLTSASPCRTLGHALTQAASGDAIKIAEGQYTEGSLSIAGNTTLAISGGWAADFGSQSPLPTRTVVNGRLQGPVLTISAAGTTVDVSLDTLTITRARDGAIVATSSGTGALTVSLVALLLKSNRSSSETEGSGAINAIVEDSSSLTMTVGNSTLKSNRGVVGGGIQARSLGSAGASLGLTVTHSTFIANRALSGGGISVVATPSSSTIVSVEGSSFKLNRATTDSGGGIHLSGGGLVSTVSDSTFVANRASVGGGISAALHGEAGSMTLTSLNSSFHRNTALQRGGALFVLNTFAAGSLVTNLKNTIAWGNTGLDTGGQDLHASVVSGSLTVNGDHCDIGDRLGPFTDLGGNVNVDPRVKRDSHLRADSPVIDAGTCTGAPPADFEGDARPTGAGCDIGADEFVP